MEGCAGGVCPHPKKIKAASRGSALGRGDAGASWLPGGPPASPTMKPAAAAAAAAETTTTTKKPPGLPIGSVWLPRQDEAGLRTPTAPRALSAPRVLPAGAHASRHSFFCSFYPPPTHLDSFFFFFFSTEGARILGFPCSVALFWGGAP